MDFSPKRVVEVEIFTVDYVNELAPGETIISAVWTNTVRSGTDATPNSMIQGDATITGTQVSQKIGAGLQGVFYSPICTAVTSLGQTLVLPEYGAGTLPVTP